MLIDINKQLSSYTSYQVKTKWCLNEMTLFEDPLYFTLFDPIKRQFVSHFCCYIHTYVSLIIYVLMSIFLLEVCSFQFWYNMPNWPSKRAIAVYRECALDKRLQGFWLLGNLDPFIIKIRIVPWLVWLSGLSASLQTKGSLVRFPV